MTHDALAHTPRPISLAVESLDDGTFEGYASLFQRPDLGGDVILPGAFRESLAARGARGIRLLFQHDPAEPIGVWESLVEDARGLYVRGRLTTGVARAREVLALMRAGAIDGLSIGFRAARARRDRPSGLRRIERIDLWEISIVTFPMLPEARIFAVSAQQRSPAPQQSRSLPRDIRAAAQRMHVRLAGNARCRASADPVIAAHALAAELAGERVLLSLMRLSLLEHKFNFDQPRLPAGNPDGGQWTTGDGGSERPQPAQARRPRGEGRFPRDHNNPPKPLPPILPPGGSDQDPPRLFDEGGQLAPRGFSRLDDLDAFRSRLAEALPADVSAVMQGSSVERGGAGFRWNKVGDVEASDFDVSLTGGDIFDLAALRLPRMVKSDRVGPLDETQLKEIGIDLTGVFRSIGRDVRFMIYRSQSEMYRRGPGYPLVTR